MPLSRTIALVRPTCTGCGACLAPCAPGAIGLETALPGGFGDKRAVLDALACTGCGRCVPACPHDALRMIERTGG